MIQIRKVLAITLGLMLTVTSLPVGFAAAAPAATITIDGAASKAITPVKQGGVTYFSLAEVSKVFSGSLKLNEKTGTHYLKIGKDVLQFKNKATTVQLNTLSYKLKKPVVQLNKIYYLSLQDLSDLFRISIVEDSKKNSFAFTNPNLSAIITSVKGSVEYLKSKSPVYAWKATKTKSYVYKDDSLRTGAKSSAEIKFSDGTTLLMGANSTIHIDELAYIKASNKRTVKVDQIEGESWVNVIKQLNGSTFSIVKGKYTMTAVGTQVYSGPANMSVISGTVVLGDENTNSAIPTGTSTLYGGTPVLMNGPGINWTDTSGWAMNQLQNAQINTTANELALAQFSQNLPKNDPLQGQLVNQVQELQGQAVWNQFEIRQNAPLTGEFPDPTSMNHFVNKQNELQAFLTGALPANSTQQKTLLEEQQTLLDQYQENLKIAEMNNLLPASTIATLDKMSNAMEAKLPATIEANPNLIPKVPLPAGVTVPEIAVPNDIKLPEGMVIPPGFSSQFSSLLPQGAMIPETFKIDLKTILPEGVILPPGIVLPDSFELPKGVVIPPNLDLSSLKLPEGIVIPKGFDLPSGIQLPTGVELPPNFKIPQGVQLPTNLSGFSAPPGLSLASGLLPAGITLPDINSILNQIKNMTASISNPNIITDAIASGGVQLPAGFTPPEGFMPPVGWTPSSAGGSLTTGAVPAGWELMPKDLAAIDPNLMKSFETGVDKIFGGSITLPQGFEIPSGITPSANFTPPTTGWTPPANWQPPTGFTAPTDWNLPTTWAPTAGFAPANGIQIPTGTNIPTELLDMSKLQGLPAGFDPSSLMNIPGMSTGSGGMPTLPSGTNPGSTMPNIPGGTIPNIPGGTIPNIPGGTIPTIPDGTTVPGGTGAPGGFTPPTDPGTGGGGGTGGGSGGGMPPGGGGMPPSGP